MYPYRVFEAALAEAFGGDGQALPAFRARLKYFHRSGIIGRSSKDGKNISYDKTDIYKCGFLLELYEFGVEPQRMKSIIDRVWPSVLGEITDHENIEGNDLYFAAIPVMMSAFISESLREDQHEGAGLTAIERNGTQFVYRASELPNFMRRRMLLVNLTILRMWVLKALKRLEPSI